MKNKLKYCIVFYLIISGCASIEVKKSAEQIINDKSIYVALIDGHKTKQSVFQSKAYEVKNKINMNFPSDTLLQNIALKLDNLLIEQQNYFSKRIKKPNKYALLGGTTGVSVWLLYLLIDKSNDLSKGLVLLAGPFSFGYGALMGALTGELIKGNEVEKKNITKINSYILDYNKIILQKNTLIREK